MPQQASSMPHANNLDTGDYRMNPLPSDSYFLQSVQYQEMMQQYIQNLMAAASALPSASPEVGSQVCAFSYNKLWQALEYVVENTVVML